MGLIGLNGQQLTSDTAEDQAGALSDDVDEKASQYITDINAVDSMNVRYFYPLNFGKDANGNVVNPEEAKLAGQRIPPEKRKWIRKQLKKHKEKTAAIERQPLTRGMFDNFLKQHMAPMDEAVMSATFFLGAVKKVLVDKEIITEKELMEESRYLNRTQRLYAAQQAMESAGMEPDVVKSKLEEMEKTLLEQEANDAHRNEEATQTTEPRTEESSVSSE